MILCAKWQNFDCSNKIDIVLRFLVAMRTPDEGERDWLAAPIPEC